MRFSIGMLAVPVALGTMFLTLSSPAHAKNPTGETVKEVAAKYVCMVEKKHFDEPQKPVTIDGRTYYACSDACAAKLLQDPASRMDVDPVSEKPLDKATAVVGVDKAGNVYFFENLENLKQFRAPMELSTSRASHPRR